MVTFPFSLEVRREGRKNGLDVDTFVGLAIATVAAPKPLVTTEFLPFYVFQT
jgi:hypothetical protein